MSARFSGGAGFLRVYIKKIKMELPESFLYKSVDIEMVLVLRDACIKKIHCIYVLKNSYARKN